MPNMLHMGFQSTMNKKAPVLLIVFNRAEVAKKVLEKIIEYGPESLFIYADGPRSGNSKDLNDCAVVRDVISACTTGLTYTVNKHFLTENVGCGVAVSGAISWFFDNVDEGIILEDDCLPSESFFDYCAWALDAYRHEKTVFHINGTNFKAPADLFDAGNVAFTPLAQAWGWATWSDRWSHYVRNSWLIYNTSKSGYKKWDLGFIACWNKLERLKRVTESLDTWDVQWQAAILNYGGLCISTKANLVSGLKIDSDTTYVIVDNPNIFLKTEPVNYLFKFEEPVKNISLTRWYAREMQLTVVHRAFKWMIQNKFGEFYNRLKFFVARLLFPTNTIIIASSGRSGSTLLTTVVAEGLVRSTYPSLFTSNIGRHLAKRVQGRVQGFLVSPFESPSSLPLIVKTHFVRNSERLSALNNAKYIFIFSDPVESIRSVQGKTKKWGKAWLERHLFHLESPSPDDSVADLWKNDSLNYVKQINSWIDEPQDNILVIQYEYLWESTELIESFLNFPITLPEKRSRTSVCTDDKFSDMTESLIQEFKKYSDITKR